MFGSERVWERGEQRGSQDIGTREERKDWEVRRGKDRRDTEDSGTRTGWRYSSRLR